MESKKHQIVVKRTAHYYVLGDIINAEKIWIVLHGYGYSASHFLKKFEKICNENTCVIAPEALSKFYVEGFDGKVGASWMTKENREAEINDYIHYLNKLYTEILTLRKNKPFKLNLLGFSQGGATAARWIAETDANITHFILWASVFPEDVCVDTFTKNNIKTYFLYGDKDVFLTEERVNFQNNMLKKSLQTVTIIPFLGKHDVPQQVLLENAKKYNW